MENFLKKDVEPTLSKLEPTDNGWPICIVWLDFGKLVPACWCRPVYPNSRQFSRCSLGMRSEKRAYVSPGPRLSGYTPGRRRQFFENTLKRVDQIPGVSGASLHRAFPVLAKVDATARLDCVPGFASQNPADFRVAWSASEPRYFEALQIPLLEGRDVTWADRQDISCCFRRHGNALTLWHSATSIQKHIP